MTTLMLVHGAWHRPAAWAKLVPELRRLGYDVRTPALPSAGTQPVAGLPEDAAELRAELATIEGPVVVLAHSYGGIPVSQALAGAEQQVTHIVYLAAYMLDKGESMFSFHGVPDPVDAPALFPLLDDPRQALYGDLSEADAQEAMSQLVCQTHRVTTDRLTEAAWRDIPSTYIVCDQDGALPPALQERLSTRANAVHHLPTSHSPFLSRPAELAALVHQIVTAQP